MRDRLRVGEAGAGMLCRKTPVDGRLLEDRGFRVVMGECLRRGPGNIGEGGEQRFGDAAVDRLPLGLEQAVVGGVLHQCVLEHIAVVRCIAGAKHQLGVHQLGKRIVEGAGVEQ